MKYHMEVSQCIMSAQMISCYSQLYLCLSFFAFSVSDPRGVAFEVFDPEGTKSSGGGRTECVVLLTVCSDTAEMTLRLVMPLAGIHHSNNHELLCGAQKNVNQSRKVPACR